jgi:hypothetical protein
LRLGWRDKSLTRSAERRVKRERSEKKREEQRTIIAIRFKYKAIKG